MTEYLPATSVGLSRRRFIGTMGGGLAGAVLLGATGCRGGLGGGTDTGGGENSGKGVSLTATWWGEGKRSERLVEAITLFEQDNPDVTVRGEYSGFNGYFDKLATRVAGGNPPNIFQLHAVSLGDYISRGVVRELDDLLADPLGLDGLPENVAESCRYDGAFMVVPLGLATAPAIVMNPAALEKAGVEAPGAEWSMEDFIALVGEIAKGTGGELFGTTEMGGAFPAFECFIRSKEAGANLFTADGGLGFDEDDVLEWYGIWAELRANRFAPPMEVSAASNGFANNEMVRGLAAMTMAPSSKGIEGYQNLMEESLQMTQFPRRKVGGTLLTPIEWFALSARMDDEAAEAAARLCNFVLTDPESLSLTQLMRGVPLFDEGREHLRTELDTPVAEQIFANFETVQSTEPWARVPYPSGTGAEFTAALGQQNEEIGFGEVTVEEGAARFFEEAQGLVG